MKTLKMVACAVLVWATLLMTGCRKHAACSGTSEKTYTSSQFDNVTVGDAMKVTIVKGNVFSVKANGCIEDLADLVVQVLPDRTLHFSYAKAVSNRKVMHLSISMPELLKLNGSGAAKISVAGLANQPIALQIHLSSAAEAVVNLVSTEVIFNLSGAAKLELSGNSAVLTGDLSSASQLKAYGLAAKQTDITASGASKAWVTAQDKLYAEASSASTIYYKGTPATIHVSTSGAGKVIKE